MLHWINTNFNLSPTLPKSTRNSPKNVQKQDADLLSTNLFGRILDLQFLCEGQQVSKEMIAVLIEHYTKAIEYYEEIESSKFIIYKKRMEHFLKKPKIDDILRGKPVRLVTIKQNAEKQINSALIKSKHEAKKLIRQSQTKADSNQNIIENNIQFQQKQLNSRIERRRTKSSRQSQSAERNLVDKLAPRQNREQRFDFLSPNHHSKDSKNKRVFI